MVKPTLFAELESLGESEVRHMLAMGKTGSVGSDHRLAVESWLAGKEREREAAHNAETLSTAKDAAAAAKTAASAAVAAAAAATAAALEAVAANKISADNLRTSKKSMAAAVVAAIAAIVAAYAAIKGIK